MPRALGPSLAYVMPVDGVEREPLRLRHRLVGTGVVRIVDEDDTGREVSAVLGGRLLEDTLADDPEMMARGFDPGPADGAAGRRTLTAIASF